MEQGKQMSIWKENIPGRGTTSTKTQRQKCACHAQGRTKRPMLGEWSGEREEESKDATGARLGKASRARQGLWLLPQAMRQRNDMSSSNLKGSTQMFTEHRQMVIRQRASQVAQTVKNLPAMWESQVQSLGGEEPLEKEMATHSRISAWRIPGRGLNLGNLDRTEPGRRSLANYTVHGVTKSWTWVSN